MSKKHKRDVLIARIVFVIFIIIVGALIYKLAAWGISKLGPKQEESQIVEESQTESEMPPFFVIDPNAPETEIVTEIETETQEVASEEPEEVLAKTNARVRMRKEPNTTCDVIVVLDQGTEVTILSEEGEWSQIKQGDNTGYVKTEYLTK